jgi:hypothetical protein
MKVKTLFLQTDTDEANKELDCYGHCLDIAVTHFLKSDFEKAAAYHENIARSLISLQHMKDNKLTAEQVVDILQRIRAREQYDELLNRLSNYHD